MSLPDRSHPARISASDGGGISVIISVYNRPLYLIRVLEGYERQTVRDFEIVLADDGSSETARAEVDEWLKASKLSVRRIWHEDRGFRKNVILNAAIRAARGDYLIFTDGDCIPFPDFIERHLRHAAPRRFLSAGAIRLERGVTQAILDGRITPERVVDRDVLIAHGMRPQWKKRRMYFASKVRAMLDAFLPIKKTFNGLNASCWKADALRVGGFNEDMGYGAEDVEFGLRLRASGIMPLRVRHRIRALHLDHEKPYATAQEIARNYAIMRQTRKAHFLSHPAVKGK